VFRFGLAETAGETVELKKLGWRFSHRDLPYASNRAHKGTLPLDGSLMKVENALVTAVKVAEDKNGLILRLVSAKSWDCVAEVSVPGLKAALLVDLAEQTISECSVVDGKVSLPMGAEQTRTLRLITG
jgi:alpha-mannosidase